MALSKPVFIWDFRPVEGPSPLGLCDTLPSQVSSFLRGAPEADKYDPRLFVPLSTSTPKPYRKSSDMDVSQVMEDEEMPSIVESPFSATMATSSSFVSSGNDAQLMNMRQLEQSLAEIELVCAGKKALPGKTHRVHFATNVVKRGKCRRTFMRRPPSPYRLRKDLYPATASRQGINVKKIAHKFKIPEKIVHRELAAASAVNLGVLSSHPSIIHSSRFALTHKATARNLIQRLKQIHN